jgi:hypothetical protein
LLVLVMLALSVGCLLYVQPELREKGMAWGAATDRFGQVANINTPARADGCAGS